MVDSDSPTTFFEIDENGQIMKRKMLFFRELPQDEEYVDFNRRKLILLRNIFFQLDVGNSKLQKARILVAEKGTKSQTGRDWLNISNYKVSSLNQKDGNNAIPTISTILEQPNKFSKPIEAAKTS